MGGVRIQASRGCVSARDRAGRARPQLRDSDVRREIPGPRGNPPARAVGVPFRLRATRVLAGTGPFELAAVAQARALVGHRSVPDRPDGGATVERVPARTAAATRPSRDARLVALAAARPRAVP